MPEGSLKIIRELRMGAPVHAVALSGNGNLMLVGTEHDLRLTDRWGHEQFRRAMPPPPNKEAEPDLPFNAVALAPDLSVGIAAERAGDFYRLEFQPDGDVTRVVWPRAPIWSESNDVYSIALDWRSGLIAIGHLGPALTVLDMCGKKRWRQHPKDDNPTTGKTWSVALSDDGETLYVGSSGVGRYILAAVDTESGRVMVGQRSQDPITALVVVPGGFGVAAALNDASMARVAAFPPDLGEEIWSYEVGFRVRITALATDPEGDIVAVGLNTGNVVLLDGRTGKRAAPALSLGSSVLSLSLAGYYMAAGVQDGRLFYLEFTPPEGEGGMLL